MSDFKRWNILDRKTLDIKDSGILTREEFNEDALSLDNAVFLTDKDTVVAINGDLVYINDSRNKQLFLGVLDSIETGDLVSLQVKPFTQYFNNDIYIDFVASDIETYIQDRIEDNYVNSDDTGFNVSYLTFNKETSTPFILSFPDPEELASELFINIFKAFGIKIIPTLDFATPSIELKITSIRKSLILNTKEINAVLDVIVSRDDKGILNRLDILDGIVETFYYLKQDDTVTTNAADPLRIFPVINEKRELDAGEVALDVAEQNMLGNVYNHLIELQVKRDNDVFRPLEDISIGDLAEIRDAETYNSVLTGVRYAKGQIVILTFGIVRKDLTQIIKRLERKRRR